jgi:hypothetical protein
MTEVGADEGGLILLRLLFQNLSGGNEEDRRNLRIVDISAETRNVRQRNVAHKLYCLNEVMVGTLLVPNMFSFTDLSKSACLLPILCLHKAERWSVVALLCTIYFKRNN